MKIENLTDKYFTKTKQIVEKFGESEVTYAVFIRRPVIYAPKLALDFLRLVGQGVDIKIQENFNVGDIVPAGEPMFYYTGPMSKLVEIETLLLQKLGVAAVSAWNAYSMCMSMPKSTFIAMGARHASNSEMDYDISYGVSVGSQLAKSKGAKAFIGSSTDNTAPLFNLEKGLGTMPHALIGYAGSTLKAAQYYHSVFPNEDMVVLIDYFAQEITDSLEVCNHFKDLVKLGKLSLRLDTHAGRYMQGLDRQKSYTVLNKYAKSAFAQYQHREDLDILTGQGVSIAAVFHLREKLDEAGFNNVKIVASSGFNFEKCKIFGELNAPVDVVGTGSYIPNKWTETYATADIIRYDGNIRVKVGREYLSSKL